MKKLAHLSVWGSIASILGVAIALRMHRVVDCILDSSPFWTFVSVFFTGTAITLNWTRIRRLSRTARFVDDRGYAAAVQGDLRALAKRQHNPNAPELNRMRELRRRMGRLGVRTPAPGLHVQDLETWSAFVLDLIDCMNAKDLKRARTIFDR